MTMTNDTPQNYLPWQTCFCDVIQSPADHYDPSFYRIADSRNVYLGEIRKVDMNWKHAPETAALWAAAPSLLKAVRLYQEGGLTHASSVAAREALALVAKGTVTKSDDEPDPSLPTRQQMIARARELYQDDDCEIDDNALLSRPEKNDDEGAWVAAWVFVRDEEAKGTVEEWARANPVEARNHGIERTKSESAEPADPRETETNAERVERMIEAEYTEDGRDNLPLVLADLRLLCDAKGWNFFQLDREARAMYLEELEALRADDLTNEHPLDRAEREHKEDQDAPLEGLGSYAT